VRYTAYPQLVAGFLRGLNLSASRFNREMIPYISENPRGRKAPKRGRKLRFDPAIFEAHFRTMERVFAWEDRCRRLLLRFTRLSPVHYASKTLAYTMISLRHYC
jgi:hypothetical protein